MSALSSEQAEERVTAQVAARILGISVWSVYRAIDRGDLDAIRPGRRYQVLLTSVRTLLRPTTARSAS
jgi:excisionase family DNA binding protein